MSNLLNNPSGTLALREAVKDQVLRRMRRWFKRNTVIAFEDWLDASKIPDLNLSSILDDLNSNHDQEILDWYELLKRLEYEQTTLDIDFYVDSINGSDSGDGSLTNPYQTIYQVTRLLPDRIEGNINIFVRSTQANPALIESFKVELGTAGQLTIQGISDPTFDSGPYTINTITQIGVTQPYGYTINVLGAPWIANGKQGKFIHLLDGVNAGKFYAISTNDASNLIIPTATDLPIAGNEFEIVTITDFVDNSPAFSQIQVEISDQYRVTTVRSGFGLCALDLTPITYFNLACPTDINCAYQLVKFTLHAGSSGSININGLNLKDTAQVINANLRNALHPTLVIAYDSGRAARSYRLLHAVITGTATIIGKHYLLQYCHVIGYILSNNNQGGKIELYDSYIKSGANKAVSINYGDDLYWSNNWVESCTDIINALRGTIHVHGQEGTVANISGYGVALGPGNLFDFSGTLLSPALGDIRWKVTLATVAYPAVAGTGVTDGVGDWVVKTS